MTVRMIITFPSRRPERRKDFKKGNRHWRKMRNELLFQASNGTRFTADQRAEFDLPDWTG